MTIMDVALQDGSRGKISLSRALRYLGVGAILLYGAIMQPTPDTLSLELIVWAAVLAWPLLAALSQARWLSIYGAFVAAALSIGLLSAARNSADPAQFSRDMIAFLFWLVGPLLVLFITSRPRQGAPVMSLDGLRLVLALAGAALSVRYLVDQEAGLAAAFRSNLRVNLEYLSSEPLVTFAFIYAALATFQTRKPLAAAAFAALFAFSSLGLVAVTYRGPLLLGAAMFLGAALLFTARRVYAAPLRALPVVVALVVALNLAAPQIAETVAKVSVKFQTVGANSKVEEFTAIFAGDTGLWATLFGNGFGVKEYVQGAGTTAGYTHNVLSYAFLKTGYLGLAFTVAALGTALAGVGLRIKTARRFAPEILTLLYIGLFQGAYKHFGYGLLLGVCLAGAREWRLRQRQTQSTALDGRRLWS